MNSQLEPITLQQSERRSNLEQVVIGYRREMLEVAKALLALRDERLYRNDFKSFGEYCKATFGFGKSRGYQLIDFAIEHEGSTKSESTTVDAAPPANERQARKARQSRKQSSPAVEPAESDPPHIRTLQDEDSAPPVESSPKTKDAEFLSAVGMTSAENFFASQIEDIWTGVAANGTDAQILATISECKRAVMNLKIELTKRMGRAA